MASPSPPLLRLAPTATGARSMWRRAAHQQREAEQAEQRAPSNRAHRARWDAQVAPLPPCRQHCLFPAPAASAQTTRCLRMPWNEPCATCDSAGPAVFANVFLWPFLVAKAVCNTRPSAQRLWPAREVVRANRPTTPVFARFLLDRRWRGLVDGVTVSTHAGTGNRLSLCTSAFSHGFSLHLCPGPTAPPGEGMQSPGTWVACF